MTEPTGEPVSADARPEDDRSQDDRSEDDRSQDDRDRGWGDEPVEPDDDERFLRERPPHW